MKRTLLFTGIACVLFLFSSDLYALEEKTEILSASVEVSPVFSLFLDNPNLPFGFVAPGQVKVLGEGRFFNELRCRSNSGRSWYIKAQLLSLRLLERQYALSFSNLKWKIAESTGASRSVAGGEFQEFSQQPVVIYSSLGDDQRGKEVILRFQYVLSPPADAPAGNYIGEIVYTMTENP